MQCPFGHGQMTKCGSSPQSETWTCTQCKFTHTKKNALGVITEIIVPLSAVAGGLAGVVTLLKYCGVENFHDLVDSLTGSDSSPGPQAPRVAASFDPNSQVAHVPGESDRYLVISLENTDHVRVSVVDPSTGAYRELLVDTTWGVGEHVGPASAGPGHDMGYFHHAPAPAPYWYTPAVCAPAPVPVAAPHPPFPDAGRSDPSWPSPAIHGAWRYDAPGFPTPQHAPEPYHQWGDPHVAGPHFDELAAAPSPESSGDSQAHDHGAPAFGDDMNGPRMAAFEGETGQGFDGVDGVQPVGDLGPTAPPGDVPC
jgi:hypothetical protein